jgi:hypothetical protein
MAKTCAAVVAGSRPEDWVKFVIASDRQCQPPLHRGCLIGYIGGGGTRLFATPLYKIVQLARIASRCQQAITRCKNFPCDFAAQTTCASRYQPYFGHQKFSQRMLCSWTFSKMMWPSV